MDRNSSGWGADDLPPDFYRESDLASRWRVSRRTLQRWRAAGAGPGWMLIGGAIRYPAEEVHDYERRMRRGERSDG